MCGKSQRQIMTAIIKNKKGEVISIGKNSYIKTHPIMIKIARSMGIFDSKKIFLHAEIDAIVKAEDISKAYSIEVYRVHKRTGSYISSKPCSICRSAIEKTPIKIIKYVSIDNELITEEL